MNASLVEVFAKKNLFFSHFHFVIFIIQPTTFKRIKLLQGHWPTKTFFVKVFIFFRF